MHFLITILLALNFSAVAQAQKVIKGNIVNESWCVVEKRPLQLQYIFDGKNLILKHMGAIINSSASSMIAEYSEKDGAIILKVREVYGSFGKSSQLMSADVSYELSGEFGKNLKLIIDDSHIKAGKDPTTFVFALKKTKVAITVLPINKETPQKM